MLQRDTTPMPKLRIVHCFRSPVGGIFRHVRDLIDEQVQAGHEVGIICDSNTGGDFEETMFENLKPKLALGLHRLAMDRSIGPRDISVIWKLYREIKSLKVDILHSHGSKGGGRSDPARARYAFTMTFARKAQNAGGYVLAAAVRELPCSSTPSST